MLDIKSHEQHINDLTSFLKVEGVDTAKVSNILQALRENYTEVNTTITDKDTKLQSFSELNEGLRNANMGLLSKLGTQLNDILPKHEDKKVVDKKEEKVLSLDDISKELLK